jgi:hypothetical protein
LVSALLDRLRAGDLDGAAAAWRGYPGSTHPDDKRLELQAFLEVAPWLVQPGIELSVTPGPSSGVPNPVVTAVSPPDGQGTRDTATFVVAVDAALVERIEAAGSPGVTPAPGTTVAPGDAVVLDWVPIEGGATAHVNGSEVPVDLDHDAMTTTVVVPPWARDEVIVTISRATPEEPNATAIWYPVAP